MAYKPLPEKIVDYETIYEHVVNRFGGDNAFNFFNHHARAVGRRLGHTLVQDMVSTLLAAKRANRVSGRDVLYAQAAAYSDAAVHVLGVPMPTSEEQDEGYVVPDLLRVADALYMGDFSVRPETLVVAVMEAADDLIANGLQKEEA